MPLIQKKKKQTLDEVLQAAYDSEINVTITMLWDGGFDVGLVNSIEFAQSDPSKWRNVLKADKLTNAIHEMILKQYPDSKYAIERRMR